jgi:hypothetical protein
VRTTIRIVLLASVVIACTNPPPRRSSPSGARAQRSSHPERPTPDESQEEAPAGRTPPPASRPSCVTVVALASDANVRMAAAIDRAFRVRQRAWEMPAEHREEDGEIGAPEARNARTALHNLNRYANEAHEAALEAGFAGGFGDILDRLRESQEIADNQAFLDMHIESEEPETAWATYGEVAHSVSDGLWEGIGNAVEHACTPLPAEVRCQWARYRVMDLVGATLVEHRRLHAPNPADAWLARLSGAFRRDGATGTAAWADGSGAAELPNADALRNAVEGAGSACAE